MLQNALRWNMILEDEIKVASKLIRRGLGEIQLIDSGNDVWFLPMLLCSSGLERILKCMHVIGKLKLDGVVPTVREMKSISHSISELLSVFLTRYFATCNLPALQQDFDFLSSDKDVQVILSLLSEFGSSGRYFNLDYLTRAKGDSDVSSEKRLRDHLASWIGDDPQTIAWMLDPAEANFILQDARTRLVILLEKIIRALARQFTMGGLAPEGRTFVLFLSSFLDLWENSFGTTQYFASGN